MNTAVFSPTQEQIDAIQFDGCFSLEACPGSGKTSVIVDRFIERTAMRATRSGLAVLSFTNAAAEEIFRRSSGTGRGSVRYPHFVGTFDSFIARYLFRPLESGIGRRVTVLESWETIGIEVRLGRPNNHVAAGLDALNEDGSGILIGRVDASQRNLLRAHSSAWVRAAATQRRRLHARGYFSCADVRAFVREKLAEPDGKRLIGLLSSRFREVLVDEAQDCDPLDVAILRALHDAGTSLVAVLDRHQAIYDFRDADVAEVDDLIRALPVLRLTANFRSSTPICQLAQSFRTDNSAVAPCGPHAGEEIPVALVPFETPEPAVSETFGATAAAVGLAPEEIVVLAHRWRDAELIAGAAGRGATETSRIGRLGHAAQLLNQPGSSGRRQAIRIAERVILEFLKISEQGEPRRIAEEHDIDRRWLTRTAFGLLKALTPVPSSSGGLNDWVEQGRRYLRGIELPNGFQGSSVGTFLRAPAASSWRIKSSRGMAPRSIHSAKGLEFPAVLIVLPLGKGQTERLLDDLEQMENTEAARVHYVGFTRPRRLLGIAVPRNALNRLVALLEVRGVPHQIVE